MKKPPAEIFSAGGFCCLDGLDLGKIRFGGSHIVVQATDGNLSGGQSLCGAVLPADGQAKVIGNAHGGADALSCTATGISDDFGLTVRWEDGSTETLTSGEVSVRGLYDYV